MLSLALFVLFVVGGSMFSDAVASGSVTAATFRLDDLREGFEGTIMSKFEAHFLLIECCWDSYYDSFEVKSSRWVALENIYNNNTTRLLSVHGLSFDCRFEVGFDCKPCTVPLARFRWQEPATTVN